MMSCVYYIKALTIAAFALCLTTVFAYPHIPSDETTLTSRSEKIFANGTDPKCPATYEVVSGDICGTIGEKHNISRAHFTEQNPDINRNCTNLWPGLTYCVSPPNGSKGAMDPKVSVTPPALLFAKEDPILIIDNKSEEPICYGVEITTGNKNDFKDVCVVGHDAYPGILVRAGEVKVIRHRPNFDGAITAISNNRRGTRFELNFQTAVKTWFNADMEFGISFSTYGPLDGRRLLDGRPSLQGETDPLAKANFVFQHLAPEEQASLLAVASPKYLNTDTTGKLILIHDDKQAPFELRYFLQIQCHFQAYVVPGSINGVVFPPGSHALEAASAADKFSFLSDSKHYLITAYPDYRQWD